MRITRTYPQPDSPEPHLGPRERALAIFTYLLDIEPEQAKDHPLFACVEHAFVQVRNATDGYVNPGLEPSLVPMLTSSRTVELDAPARFVADEGKL